MQIKLINCDVKLKAMGIDMQLIGSFDTLNSELSQRLAFNGLEYNFPPLDNMLVDVDDVTVIPDLTDFGEVVLDDDPAW